ncbi:hypothetical protein BDV59DRAFT_200753 [Aspergillus ambiguus]|uniref:uncharacterized protein n=1 Tax=Aspergillus ambiguus TaxID=176160 RepID=UPI003CCE01C8
MPPANVHSMIEEHAEKLLDQDLKLVASFTTDMHHTHDGMDFLEAELGIFNKTVYDLFSTPAYQPNALEARAAVNGECKGHGNIEDNLSENQIEQICIATPLSAMSGVWSIIHVIESKLCVEAGTCHPLESCKTVTGYLKMAGPGLTSFEVKKYCPDFLSFFVKCKGNAEATAENRGLEMTTFNSQKDYNCNKANKENARRSEQTIG